MYLNQEQHHHFSPLQQLLIRLHHLLFIKDIEMLEVQTGLASFGFGMWLTLSAIFNWGMLRNPAWATMRNLMPEGAWGVVYALVGLAVLIAVLLNHHYGRMAATFMSTIGFIFALTMLAMTNLYTTGTPIYTVLTLSAAWSFWRNCARAI